MRQPPHWLEEAYASAIADTDTGLLQRNLEHARFLNLLLQAAFGPGGRYVDVAGGYGVLTRPLRDRGFDAYRTDKYCANLFALDHEPIEGLQAQALFAFEVLEHVTDPLAFLREVLAPTPAAEPDLARPRGGPGAAAGRCARRRGAVSPSGAGAPVTNCQHALPSLNAGARARRRPCD